MPQANSKDRRHSGRMQAPSTLKADWEYILNNCLEPEEFWSDWVDYRDSMRHPVDKTKIRSLHFFAAEYLQVKKYNQKNKMLLKRRKQMKVKRP